MRFALWVLAVAIGEVLGIYTGAVLAQERGMTVIGTLWPSGNGPCQYFTDPEGDSLSIILSATDGDYLCGWLDGNAKHGTRMVITLKPEPK